MRGRSGELTDNQAKVLMAVRLGHVTSQFVRVRGVYHTQWLLNDRNVSDIIQHLIQRKLIRVRRDPTGVKKVE